MCGGKLLLNDFVQRPGLGDVAVFRVTLAWTDADQRYEDENIF
jgi:hypothetical protein